MDLLDGTFEWDEDTPSEFRELLSTFQTDPKKRDKVSFNLKYEAFQKFVQYSKEKTSTSPSSRHYGHYKALLDEAPNALHDIFRLMKLSVSKGIFLHRYKKTLTTLICKETGTPYLHRFRPIHIIEAELQFISKSIWAKKMINKAEKEDLITDAQYGGRAGRQAQSSVLNTVLYYDVHRQLRKDFTSNDDDMKANYDREIPHYVAAEARTVGMTHEAGEFLVQATSSQEYFIRTHNGTSKASYSFNEKRPIWGLGQGVGWAGACWQITATTISKCMDKNCLGIYLCCPEKEIEIRKLMDFFIDDTKKVCNQTRSGMSLRDQTELNMQKHAYYISTTGGSLALDKCTWYQIVFSFDSNGEPFVLSKDEMPGEIEVFKNFEGQKVKIKRLEFDEAHRTLGYFVSPDGNSDAHYLFTKDLVSKWKNRVMSSRLNNAQILKSYETVLKRQLVYRMVSTSFTYHQCDTMMKQISPSLLHAANIQEHFPRSISESGPEYAGFNWTHLYDLHGQEKLQFFMMHLRKGDTTGNLLQMSMKYTQLHLGVQSPFFSLDYDEYEYLCQDRTWIQHLWEYTSSRGLEVAITDPIVFPSVFEKDTFIMDVLHESDEMTRLECQIANKVRLSLQILHLSDIVDGRGKRLLPDVRNGKIRRGSTLTWPRQVLLTKWMPTWQKACGVLQRYVSSHHIGKKTAPSHQQHIWTTDAAHEYITNGVKVYRRTILKNKQFYVDTKTSLPSIVLCIHDADVTFNKDRPKIIFVCESCSNSSDKSTNTLNAGSYLSNQHFWGKIFGSWNDSLTPAVEKIIVQEICDGNILLGLDGSVTGGMGAYSFGIFTSDSNALYMHHGPLHGEPEPASTA